MGEILVRGCGAGDGIWDIRCVKMGEGRAQFDCRLQRAMYGKRLYAIRTHWSAGWRRRTF